MNDDLKLLNTCLRANKIASNASKTKIILLNWKSQSNIAKEAQQKTFANTYLADFGH